MSIVFQSCKDFIQPKILSLVCIPFILNLVFIGSMLYGFGHSFYEYSLSFSPQWLQNITFNPAIWAKILSITYLASIYLLLLCCLVVLALVFNLFLSLFYTPFLVRYVHAKDFKHIALHPFGTIGGDILSFLKDTSIFVILLLLCIPLYFIPLLGSVALFVTCFLYFKKRTFYDVASSIMDKTQFQALNCKGLVNYFYALLAYIPSFIPFASLFLMPLQILIITRYMFCALSKT
ncbi:EI24 domain-containing protein [Helicobacter marmotae]|uniref:EI24 domain-containing protein n=1 Tax=Helicobacter marmotae TaxID=152490 RepID=A0A3D8I953_9HELI|nr:EI24 domain-containing protein [Helicobacter marmotae]RDU61071.1 hypothetical protein CQA63_00765 [Helicobacter marmotae]